MLRDRGIPQRADAFGISSALLVPVRFEEETLREIRRLADEDERSVSALIRGAVERALKQQRAAG